MADEVRLEHPVGPVVQEVLQGAVAKIEKTGCSLGVNGVLFANRDPSAPLRDNRTLQPG